MAKYMTTDELDFHIGEALRELRTLLEQWSRADDPDKKRAQLLAYWVKTYTHLLQRESSFNPASIPRLTHRQIVNVDFGYRVGAELGGLHYAIVLDKNNGLRGNTVTVIPLGSVKEEFRPSRHKVLLQDGIHGPLQEKILSQIAEARALAVSMVDDSALRALPEDQQMEEVARRFATAQSKLQELQASQARMDKLKAGSVANISQITTISKLRIKEPLTPHSVLYGVKASPRDMELVEDGIWSLYLTGKKQPNR